MLMVGQSSMPMAGCDNKKDGERRGEGRSIIPWPSVKFSNLAGIKVFKLLTIPFKVLTDRVKGLILCIIRAPMVPP